MEEMLIHTSGSITVRYCSNPDGHAPADCPDYIRPNEESDGTAFDLPDYGVDLGLLADGDIDR